MKDILIQLGSFLGVFVPLFSLLYSIRVDASRKLIEEFNFARSFLEEKDHLKNSFVIEKGYQAIAGSERFDIDVIKHLLDFPHPCRALKDYKISHSLFEEKNNSENRLVFKWRYRYKWCRYSLATFHFFKYWLSGMVTFYAFLSPIFIPEFIVNFLNWLGVKPDQYLIAMLVLAAISLYLVITSVQSFAIYIRAYYLLEQEKQILNYNK
ncbi:hypothetical protein [Photobacterium leiognathi]|uniref:hypothetical protein n=1 Tax=Photobacterium leiognathi TaxID=553611 RepID=UPI002980CE07|nr:hypothetical protein [Photobacterium leiognathi]